MTAAAGILSLADLRKGARGRVIAVAEDPTLLGEVSGATVAMRLLEIGFVPGETFEVIAEARPGGDPIAVRIGGTSFALRRREAAAVLVTAEAGGDP